MKAPVESETTKDFRTYHNYLCNLHLFIEDKYSNPKNLVDGIRESSQYKKIQRNTRLDTNQLAKYLRNAWFTEVQMRRSASTLEIMSLSNHWIPVQSYYCAYLALRAFFVSGNMSIQQSHAATLKAIASEIHRRPGLFPHPWRVLCSGDSNASGFTFENLPSGVHPHKISSLSAPQSVNFWDSYVMFLRTTRAKQIKKKIDRWKKDKKRKRILSKERPHVLSSIPKTSIFDLLYRLRVRSNYEDADAFILSLNDEHGARGYSRAVLGNTWYTMLVLESAIRQYSGSTVYGQLVEEFIGDCESSYAEDLVGERHKLLV